LGQKHGRWTSLNSADFQSTPSNGGYHVNDCRSRDVSESCPCLISFPVMFYRMRLWFPPSRNPVLFTFVLWPSPAV
jgi:hypothetical protein